MSEHSGSEPRAGHFIAALVEEDLRAQRYHRPVMTRFPPEPNGYPHIGHAKSICLNFGLAADYGGVCNLRYDDTNPATEDQEYVDAILRDVRWLGFDPGERIYHAADYALPLYNFAVHLIEKGLAYVDEQSDEQIRATRGTVSEPGTPSPWRDRPVAENLDLFARMKAGEFPDGAMVLRAKIDLANPNMKMRDPLLYRIRHEPHYRTGTTWCIYPFYDFAHGLSDAIEGVTHSICTLEFENNRELYDWLLWAADVPEPPRQIEFARLGLNYTVMSKRKLLALVNDGLVEGWDDPRMPTLSGLRRRGVPPAAIRDFCDKVGVARANSTVDFALLESCVRDELNRSAPRVMAVLKPLRLLVEGWPEDRVDWIEAPHFPTGEGPSRAVPFSRELFIEEDDFSLDPPKGFHRLAPGREVRLRYGYVVKCTGVDQDSTGNVTAVRCSFDPDSRGGDTADGRRIRGTLHWVSAAHARSVEVRLYDRLFRVPNPGEDRDFKEDLNPDSLRVLTALVEPAAGDLAPGSAVQFERHGYFFADPSLSQPGAPVMNRVVALKDTWTRAAEPEPPRPPAEPAKVEAARPEPRAVPVDPALAAAQAAFIAAGVGEGEAATLAAEPALAALFEAALPEAKHNPRAVASWICNELLGLWRPGAAQPFDGAALGELVAMLDEGALSTPLAKAVLGVLVAEGGRPRQIAQERGLQPIQDQGALATLVEQVLGDNAAQVQRYRGGKAQLFGFFVGAVMKASGGRADPAAVSALLRAQLDGPASQTPPVV